MSEAAVVNARQGIKIVTRELDDLYMIQRNQDDLITLQQEEIRLMREEGEKKDSMHAHDIAYLTKLKMQAKERSDHSLVQMYLALLGAFIALGYAVYIS